MERKVGEVFNDGENKIEVVEYDGSCIDCFYDRLAKCPSGCTNTDLKFIKIGESKMETKKQILLRQIKEIEQRLEDAEKNSQEQEQRRKDNQKTLNEMKKQLEELNKKEEQPTVSATGCFLKQLDYGKNYFYISHTNVVSDYMFTQSSDKERFNINNCFSTREQAEQEALRREGQEFIRRCAMLRNKSNDWRKQKNVRQFYVDFDTIINKLGIEYNIVYTGGAIYFDTMELTEKCIAELKAKYNEEQIKTIFGVI